MRRISVPYELALPYLLEMRDVPVPVRDLFAQSISQIDLGLLDEALKTTEQAHAVTTRRRDRYGEVLALLLRADVLRRRQCWEDSLEAIRQALYWLELRVSPEAHYNEAVAVYLEGLVHWTLGADTRVLETFAYAQEAFVESERYWTYEQHEARAADCRDVVRWMSQILQLQDSLPPDEPSMILPVYEVVHTTRVRTDVYAVRPFPVEMPTDVLSSFLPPDISPVGPDGPPLAWLDLCADYVAVRIVQDGSVFSSARRGDLLIVEVTGVQPATGEIALRSERSFVRRTDGRVEFRSVRCQVPDASVFSTRGLSGVPRWLIREGNRPSWNTENTAC